jgi:DNA uptake protein ComE-like DNA-binding protein
MNKFLRVFCGILGTFGLAGLTPTSVFAVERVDHDMHAKIDVNHASEQELEALPGIGATYAKKIIAGRPYKNEADLLKADIPQDTINKIKHSIRFGKIRTLKAPDAIEKVTRSTHSRVDVNHASEQELEELPGIGKTYAKKIIAGRPYKTEADLLRADIPQSTIDKLRHSIRFGAIRMEKIPEKEPRIDSKRTNTSSKEDTVRVAPQKGMVWVNTETKVYHLEGDRWYGNTEKGQFMTEKDAIKYGAHLSEHPDHHLPK